MKLTSMKLTRFLFAALFLMATPIAFAGLPTVAIVPGAPIIGAAIGGNAQATVSFSAPISDGGSPIISYTAISAPSGITGSCTAPCSSIVVNGLSNSTAYIFTVIAVNSVGPSAPSVASNSVTPVAPVTTFTVSTSAGANGSITPAAQTVTSGNTTSFTVTPNTGYYTASASGCGGSLNGSTYTTGAITADCTVSATFVTSPKASQTIGAINFSPTTLAVNGTITASATATSNLAVSFTSTTPGVCTASGSTVTGVAAGTCTIAADQAGNANYNAATQVTQNITIGGTPLNLTTGWNLIGNSNATSIDVATIFVDASKITTVWKWNKAASKWAFYAPSMTLFALTTYAQGKGYDVLTSIAPKEGFWVNASAAVALTGSVANGVTLVESDMQPGWNLVGSADNKTPSQLNAGLSGSLNAAGKAIVTAWAWDATNTKWKFYAPALEAQGGTVLADYITNKGYLPFFNTALSASDGFWLNIGAVSPTPIAGGSGTAAQYFTKNAVGNTWTLLYSGIGASNFTTTNTITASAGGVVTANTTSSAGSILTSTRYIDTTGALVLYTGLQYFGMSLPATFSVGTTWIQMPATAVQGAMNATIAAFNVTRTVPAGTFTDCLQINIISTTTNGGGTTISNLTQYLSPSAGGLVEMTGTTSSSSTSNTWTTQLQAGYVANP